MFADPQISSWSILESGQYARLYESTTSEQAGTYVTTWNRSAGVQNQPTYSGVSQVAYSDDWVYLRTTGLGIHVMGPWYLNSAKTRDFPNYPANSASIYRIPRTPTIPDTKIASGAGVIGRYVDGVAMFDARDTFSYDTSAGEDQEPVNTANGDDVWNRDAYINESVTFDAALAHQAGSTYHYHANSPALRHQLGDSVDYDRGTNTYTENFNGRHSPILGYAADGIPVYGPYSYSDPLDPSSPVRLIVSGFVKRDGEHGTTDLTIARATDMNGTATGRTTVPPWISAITGQSTTLPSTLYGPPVNATFILGHYLEDYAYLGNLTNPEDGQPYEQGVDFDLNEHNVRYGITPEYPQGTYAYFVSIESDGTPRFPYAVGRSYFGNPSGGNVSVITEDVTVDFNGGPRKELGPADFEIDSASSEVSLVWSAVEGGTYRVESTTTLENGEWRDEGASFVLTGSASPTLTTSPTSLAGRFLRLTQDGLADFDAAGFDLTGNGGVATGTSFTFTFNPTPPLPPQDVFTSITVGSVSAAISSLDRTNGTATLVFDDSVLANGSYTATLTFTRPNGNTVNRTSTNTFIVP